MVVLQSQTLKQKVKVGLHETIWSVGKFSLYEILIQNIFMWKTYCGVDVLQKYFNTKFRNIAFIIAFAQHMHIRTGKLEQV